MNSEARKKHRRGDGRKKTVEHAEDAGSSVPDAEDDFDMDAYLLTHLPEYDEYLGKHLLMSLTYLDEASTVADKAQLHGVITRINEAIIAVDLQDTGEEFTLPADLSALTVAPEGEYRLKPSGDVVVNPDYLVVYTIGKSEAEDREAVC